MWIISRTKNTGRWMTKLTFGGGEWEATRECARCERHPQRLDGHGRAVCRTGAPSCGLLCWGRRMERRIFQFYHPLSSSSELKRQGSRQELSAVFVWWKLMPASGKHGIGALGYGVEPAHGS